MDIKYKEYLMNTKYKEYLVLQRTTELEVFHLEISKNISASLKNAVKEFCKIEFKDGEYHTYYGDFMRNVNNFTNFANDVMDEVVKLANKYCNEIDKHGLIDLIEKCADTEKANHIGFCKEFLPVSLPEQKQLYEDFTNRYNSRLENLNDLKASVEKLRKPIHTAHCIEYHMTVTQERTAEIIKVTQAFIGLFCNNEIPKLRSSLKELIGRVRHNLRQMETKSKHEYHVLVQDLYEMNKEKTHLFRQYKRSSVKIAQAMKVISELQHKLQDFSKDDLLKMLRNELQYWESRSRDFESTVQLIHKMDQEIENVEQIDEAHHSNPKKCMTATGERSYCWFVSAENIKSRIVFLKGKRMDAVKGLLTHFGGRGPVHKLYEDESGTFYIDEYQHRIYLFNNGIDACHLDCEGRFQTIDNRSIHYSDSMGRFYKTDDGEKVYQRAPCSSNYKLADNDLLTKDTKDCGHSERFNPDCGLNMKDPRDDEILPDFEPINIEKSMNPVDVKYLWEAFGAILPDALNDVATLQPKNPIHYLAHRIIYHKYGKTQKELAAKHKDAMEYRDAIYQKRKMMELAEAKAWRSKQVRRATATDLDDADERAVYDAQNMAMHDIVCDMIRDDA